MIRFSFRLLGVLLLALAPAASRAGAMSPLLPSLPLTVTMTSDTALTLDSNSPATAGPRAMYVAFRVTNTSGAAVSNLTATIGGFASGIALAGGQVAAQYIGSIPAGGSRTVYWFITYPATFNVRNVLSVSVTDGAGGTASGSGPVRTLAMLSAAAGGSTSASAIGAGAVVGQMIPLDVTFQFKGWKVGDTFNLQPAGNTSFAAGCFQLQRSQIISADANLSSVIVPGTVDRQFFVATVASSGGGSTWNVVIRYEFRYMCAGATSTPLPYSNMLSGTQLKYAADYGEGTGDPGAIPPAPNPSASFTIAKSVSAAQVPGAGSIIYTVAITNISTFNATIDSIADDLPSGFSFSGIASGSDVTAANSGGIPSPGATGRIVFRGNAGTTYAVAAGATLTLRYTVAVPGSAGEFFNRAAAYVGSTLLGRDSVLVTVGTADVTVTKTAPANVAAQDTIHYVVVVSNTGPQNAYRITAYDTLPSSVTFVRATRTPALSGRALTWPTLTSLAAGSSVTDTVVVLAPSSLGSIVNLAHATSTSYDPNLGNNNGTGSTNQVAVNVVSPVVVTPDGLGTPTKRLPGTRYSQPFVVENIGSVGGSYGVLASAGGAAGLLTVDSITGPSVTARPRSDSIVISLAARTANTYQLWYTVAPGDTALGLARLRARHLTAATYTDTGYAEVRRAYPAIAIAKTVATPPEIVPGVELTYTIRFTNVGENDASAVALTEEVPVETQLKLGTLSSVLPGALTASVTYSNDGGATWTYVPVSEGCGAPAGFDACVNRIRWTVSGALPAGAPEGVLSYVARLR